MIDQLFTVQRVDYAYESREPPYVYQYTHGSDLDGWSSAVVVRRFVGAQHLPAFVGYDDIDEALERHIAETKSGVIPPHALVITDICPSKPTVAELHRHRHLFAGLQLFDHHETTTWVSEYNWAHHDITASGTLLTFEHLIATRPAWARHPLPPEMKMVDVNGTVMWSQRPEEKTHGVRPFLAKSETLQALRAYVAAVDAYDMWNLDSPHRPRGERLNVLAHFLGRERYFYAYSNWGVSVDLQPDVNYLIRIVHENIQSRAASVLNAQKAQMLHRNTAGDEYAVIVPGDHALVGPISEALRANYPNLAFCVFVDPVGGVVSLRSGNINIDLSAIAEKNGGGGHKKSAGFHLDIRGSIYKQITELF